MQGWFKFHRVLFEKPIWITSTPEQKTILITLMGMANHKEAEWEFKGEKFSVDKGQFITSLESIVANCGKGVSLQNVRTALKRFEKYGFLTNESTNKNRLITIVNWGIYQGEDDEPNKQTNKQLTSNQQATNKQLTTNKNKENKENEKKKDYTSEIKEFLVRYQAIENFNKLNKDYWDVIRNTRVSKKVSQSVIHKNMDLWNKFDPIVVQYALKAHVDAHHGKREEYTVGIMRRTSVQEAKDRLDTKVVPFAKKQNASADINKIREMLGE